MINPVPRGEWGASLIELMAVISILAIMAVASIPSLSQQMATLELETIARRFIAHAHFARQQALVLGEMTRIAPIKANNWDNGWNVQGGNQYSKIWFAQGSIYPVYLKDEGKQFIDPHSGQKGIIFNAAGAAKTGHGGFVANRLILGHQHMPQLERQLILGSGGRWRICNPQIDLRRCY